jgi:soluble lytic murein transglycosylase-like protein
MLSAAHESPACRLHSAPDAAPHAQPDMPAPDVAGNAPHRRRRWRRWVALASMVALSACASQHARLDSAQEAAQYAARAKRSYQPPGPPGDPWGPYIQEAATRFDMPERWVRGVMHAESDGRMYEHGQLITSDAGAMGLMQVMPPTYDELRARYALGDDPYDPHDNIMAGVAYMREMYDAYGAPAFLAAYNAGPRRLDDYLTRNRPLPLETRRYVAKIGPWLADSQPARISAAQQYAVNQIPTNIPDGPRYPSTPRKQRKGEAPVALAANRAAKARGEAAPVQVAALTAPPVPPPLPSAPAQRSGGFHLIPQAMAESLPVSRGGPAGGRWAIQVGAYTTAGQARFAADQVRGQARELLATAQPAVGSVRQGSTTLYRARLTGLSRDTAIRACERVSRGRNGCIVVAPDAQS